MSVRTTVIGSWWKRPEDEADLDRIQAGELTGPEADDVLTRCAVQAIAEQRELGLDEWTGGEFWTLNFIDHLQRQVTGIEIYKPAEPETFDYDDLAGAKVVGEISAPEGMGYADAYERERELPGGVTKACVVGPWELVIHATFHDRENVDAQLDRLIAIVNREIRQMADAGCPNVALDTPFIAIEANMGHFAGHMNTLDPDLAADVIARCFEGVSGATRTLHLCNGNLMGRPSSGVLAIAPWVEILERLDGVIDVASLECSYLSQYFTRDSVAALPRSMDLAAGILDETSYWVESVKKLRDRAADWARVVGEERLILSPTCGFGRHPARDTPVLRQKMENLVEAAASL